MAMMVPIAVFTLLALAQSNNELHVRGLHPEGISEMGCGL
jgi:hypothetical protein